MGGGMLAVLLGSWGHRFADISFAKTLAAIVGPLRRITLALGRVIVWVDRILREWPAAAISLMILAILFGMALLTKG
jgi:hypothetical protein